jgi:23S rRNA (adenine2503-C2)-methyltransferase
MNPSKPYAFDQSMPEWQSWVQEKNSPAYLGKEIYRWIYSKKVVDPKGFTNIPAPLRKSLEESFDWTLPLIDSHLISQDGSEKFLLKVPGDYLIEMVLMPYENRATLCLSSQVGCKMGCTFCQTGKMGYKRNLSSGEILAQILIASQSYPISNIVFMGMGEPLDNYDMVVKACLTMIDPEALALSKSRVTVSTSGLVPEIEKLGKDLPVRLAISLHQADDQKRSDMMPINRKYPLPVLKEALLKYPAPDRYGITFEYVMIAGANDSLIDAKKLVKFLHGLKAKVNLIPINHFPGMDMLPSQKEALEAFQSYLSTRSIPAPIRYSRGQDISGGCGQLAAKRKSELNMDPRKLHQLRRTEALK